MAVLIGAGDALDDARARLRGMSPQQRAELSESLKQFELQATPDLQQSVRDIDRQLTALAIEDRTRYLAVLRRYHNWLDSLPEKVRDNLQAKPPGDRMAQIKTLVTHYPVARESTPYWLQFADVAGATPFELATIFKIWQELEPEQRKEIEAITAPGQRRAKMLEYGRELKLYREIRPADFSIDDWVPKVEAKLSELQTYDPEIRAALNKAEAVFNKKPESKQKAAHGIPPLMRRLAINLYYLEQPPPKPVDPQRLAQFFAAMPPWVRAHFDTYSADEARRRLTLVYRVLFPNSEFGVRKSEPVKKSPSPAPRPPSSPTPVPHPENSPAKEPGKEAGNSPF